MLLVVDACAEGVYVFGFKSVFLVVGLGGERRGSLGMIDECYVLMTPGPF
jgi:hypothetical protein